MRRGGRRSQIEGRRGRRLFAVVGVREVARAEPATTRSGTLTTEREEGFTRRLNPSYTRVVTRTLRRTPNPANTGESARDLRGQTVEAEDRVKLDRLRRHTGLSVLEVEEGGA